MRELRTVGILGGMGPLAGNYLERLLIDLNFTAKKDQDHVPFVHIAISNLPSRVSFINGVGPDPVPEMIDGLKRLEKAGASYCVIPCNTAHILWNRYFGEVEKMKMIHLIKETCDWMGLNLKINKIGLLATKETIEFGLYQKYLSKYKIEIATPADNDQQIVTDCIFSESVGVKATGGGVRNETVRLLTRVIVRMKEKNDLKLVIAGCTEISVVFGESIVEGVQIIDPLHVIARKMLKIAGVSLS